MRTPHGTVQTPAFMPVATKATVKALSPQDIRDAGAQAIISNALHLYIAPGVQTVKSHGGLHGFMGWDGCIFTDSGGFQAVRDFKTKFCGDSLRFQSYRDGKAIELTPELAVQTQEALGSDVLMCLDWCPHHGSKQGTLEESVALTTKWAARCKAAFRNETGKSLLFGIVQGGLDRALRKNSAADLVGIGFDGYAIGGLCLGETALEMADATAYTCTLLPADRPRYLMGVGSVADLLGSIAAGVDIFDSAFPTRNARHKTIITPGGHYDITREIFHDDMAPLSEGCKCPACARHTRAYLHHLFRERELLAYRLASIHNLHVTLGIVREAREAIVRGEFEEFRRAAVAEKRP